MPSEKKPTVPGQKVLLYDVESSPNIGYTWGTWEQHVIKVIQRRQIISFAWKWLGENKVSVLALPDFKSYRRHPTNNLGLLRELHRQISMADIAVAHNIDEFDDKMSNTDFLLSGFPPPPPHRTVDTLKFARFKFRLNSNKLDDLGQELGVGRKVKHEGFELWDKCLHGDMDAWARMKRYNKGDVALLEKVYLRLRPWMANHPNMSAPDRLDGCRVCRSRNMKPEGNRYNQSGKVPRFSCRDCGAWSCGQLVNIDPPKPVKTAGKMWRFK